MRHFQLTSVLPYALAIFLGASLLFLVQPMVARMVLPWYGGSAAVWATCMLFFQALLLLGYGYAHWVSRIPFPLQGRIHAGLLLLAALCLPLTLNQAWKPTPDNAPIPSLLWLLTRMVGLPYLALATTSPLIQTWFRDRIPGVSPYRLYALSNLGSLLALLGYPLLMEPWLDLRVHGLVWSAAFWVFALLVGALALAKVKTQSTVPSVEDTLPHPAPGAGQVVKWVLLAMSASVLMLAVTSQLTQNVAPIPFLWVLPLALYLVSFILCFEGRQWYRPKLWMPLLPFGIGALALLASESRLLGPLVMQITWALLALFVVFMVAHGELARLRPHPSHLTGFYLWISVGGALGGLLVGVIAPLFFKWDLELFLGLFLIVGLAWMCFASSLRSLWRRVAWQGLLGGGAALAILVMGQRLISDGDAIYSGRNFYGTIQVVDEGKGEIHMRAMMHGVIEHGAQFMQKDLQHNPTTYFTHSSGVGRVMEAYKDRGPLKVGIVGLGVGTLAAWGQKGDVYRFYEINPQVVDAAKSLFSFLKDSPASTEIILGDARLSLEREQPQAYDIYIVDAFSGDSIPIHLLTLEALKLYQKHLKPGGALCVHVSNRYVDLPPVLQAAAPRLGMWTCLIQDKGDLGRWATASTWVVLGRYPENVWLKQALQTYEKEGAFPKQNQIWTDERNYLLPFLK